MPQTPTSKETTRQYRFIGDHAVELEVGDTRPQVGPGDFVDLSNSDAGNEKTKTLIDEGFLVDVVQATQQAEADAAAAQAAAQAEAEATAIPVPTIDEDKKGGK